MTYILTYKFAPGYLKMRIPHRAVHFDYLNKYIERQKLLLGGATEEDFPVGILVFHNLDKEDIYEFAKNDPYVINNVVRSYKIKQWNVVAGSLVENLKTM